jgi:hypothetical protein
MIGFREDRAAVGEDVELPVAAGRCGDVVPGSFQLGGETRGPRVVPASGGAVEDLDPH